MWTNIKDEPTGGASCVHLPHDKPGPCERGAGKRNVQILVLTPDLRLLNVVSGYVSAEELYRELDTSTEIAGRMRSGTGARAAALVSASHRVILEYPPQYEGELAGRQLKYWRRDHMFMVARPLMDGAAFEVIELHGKGRSFFSTAAPGEQRPYIGDPRARAAYPRFLEVLSNCPNRKQMSD